MFKPLARLLGNKQNDKTQKKPQPKPNQPTNEPTKTEGRVKPAMIVKIDFQPKLRILSKLKLITL